MKSSCRPGYNSAKKSLLSTNTTFQPSGSSTDVIFVFSPGRGPGSRTTLPPRSPDNCLTASAVLYTSCKQHLYSVVHAKWCFVGPNWLSVHQQFQCTEQAAIQHSIISSHDAVFSIQACIMGFCANAICKQGGHAAPAVAWNALKYFAWSAHQTPELLLQACQDIGVAGEQYHCTSELRATWA